MIHTTHRAPRWATLAAGLALAAVAGSACASSTDHVRLGKVDVHTLRDEYNNVHAVKSGGNVFLVDAGLPSSAAALVEQLEEIGVDPKEVRAIIVTHGHADHAGGAGAFRAAYGARVIAGAGDEERFEAGTNGTLCPTGSIAEGRIEEDQAATWEPYEPGTWIDEPTDLAPIAGIPGVILPMAGHTEGSLVVIVGEAAFVGDLFRGSVVGSGAETHFYMCDLDDNRRDIRGLLDAYPKVRTYFTGHFGPISREALEDYLVERAP